MPTKPILIDALRINVGGGLMLLNYLVSSLLVKGVDFMLLKDFRCPELEKEKQIRNILVMKPDKKARKDFYQNHGEDYHSVFCFGNVPPPVRLRTKVYTYFHNVSFLKVPKDYSLKWRILSHLKRIYLKRYVSYSDIWIAQTSYTASLLKNRLIKGRRPVKIIPFYKIPHKLKTPGVSPRTDYVYIGEYTNAKGQQYLLEAWKMLVSEGFRTTLHLTVTDPDFCHVIESAASAGVPVVNHGHVDFDSVIALYHKSKATVYPSLNESLGLGIVEACEAGCDVIGVDLPYMHSVCNPSVTFQSCNSRSIADAVKAYEKERKSTSIKINDMIDDLINLLVS